MGIPASLPWIGPYWSRGASDAKDSHVYNKTNNFYPSIPDKKDMERGQGELGISSPHQHCHSQHAYYEKDRIYPKHLVNIFTRGKKW